MELKKSKELRLGLHPPQAKLSITSSSGSSINVTHDNLSSCNTTNTCVHLTQLITKSVKASIHVHKLCHDGLKSHP